MFGRKDGQDSGAEKAGDALFFVHGRRRAQNVRLGTAFFDEKRGKNRASLLADRV